MDTGCNWNHVGTSSHSHKSLRDACEPAPVDPRVSGYRQFQGKVVKVMKWPDFCTDELPDYTELSGFERDRKLATRGGKAHE
jgi:hypothetical protein